RGTAARVEPANTTTVGRVSRRAVPSVPTGTGESRRADIHSVVVRRTSARRGNGADSDAAHRQRTRRRLRCCGAGGYRGHRGKRTRFPTARAVDRPQGTAHDTGPGRGGIHRVLVGSTAPALHGVVVDHIARR